MFFLPLLLLLSVSLYLEKGGVPQKEENPLCFGFLSSVFPMEPGAGVCAHSYHLPVWECPPGTFRTGSRTGRGRGQMIQVDFDPGGNYGHKLWIHILEPI